MKLVILEPLGVEEEKLLALAEEKLGNRAEIVYYDTRVTDPDTLAGRAEDADIAVISNLPFKKEVMERCPKLKMLSVAFTGVDHVDMDYCHERGILVSNCAGYSNTAVSELVFGLALSLYRRIIECDRAVRAGKDKTGLVGLELSGKKFGIIGMGAIGTRTAQLAKAFGCEVLGFNRSPRQIEGVRMTDLDTLLSECDIVSLHVPLTDETKGLIGERELSLMKPDAVLINTARGPVVDSRALAAALKEGRLAGAAVDVYETEPPIAQDHPLLTAPNVTATPHVAFATKEALYQRAVIVFDNVAGYLDGKPQNVM
ncbi:MAG TPA: hydroxyacid dehydrogenase [Candidatus Eisenbergiella pullistercoris]|uniref:Hydroxyacid dehydrogenase n=1 Tax=Candidatus Eisenbergiella pullistercoris TaxID=2838555 RepID=A0A9D1YN81_9FIRM|nr:hydroxyacid dehydrogenase [Candidatus Eisenbergiella pullistercoris]